MNIEFPKYVKCISNKHNMVRKNKVYKIFDEYVRDEIFGNYPVHYQHACNLFIEVSEIEYLTTIEYMKIYTFLSIKILCFNISKYISL